MREKGKIPRPASDSLNCDPARWREYDGVHAHPRNLRVFCISTPCKCGQNRVMTFAPVKGLPSGPQLPLQVTPAHVQSGAGEVRIGPILVIPQLLKELGVNPSTAFARAGVPLSLFNDPEARLSMDSTGQLLAECASLSKCPHFGLLVGDRFSLDSLGPLGELMRSSPSVGSALRHFLQYLPMVDRSAAPLLLLLLPPEGNNAVLGYSLVRHATPHKGPIYDTVMAIAHRILLALCGDTFTPVGVQFPCRRPASVDAYRRIFHAPSSFDAEVAGVAFAASWLARPVAGAEAVRHQALLQAMQQAQAASTISLGEKVERTLHQMLLGGQGTADAVARCLCVSQRTLRRRLAAEGRSFQEMLNQARYELACQLLHNTLLPVSHIAAALQYADANAFTRAFHGWAGSSPTEWRAASNR